MKKKIRELEAREQERTQVHEGAKTQNAGQSPQQAPPQAELEKEFGKQLGQSFQEASQPQVDGQEKQVPPTHHVPAVSRFQERYRIMKEHGDERDSDPDPDKTP